MVRESMGGPGPSTLASRRLSIPPKVSQIDADDLDEALVGMLGERIERSLGNLRVSHSESRGEAHANEAGKRFL